VKSAAPIADSDDEDAEAEAMALLGEYS